MIKVLHCLNLLIPGGVEQRRMSLFVRLPKEDYQHRVICVKVKHPEYADEMRKHVVAIDETGFVHSVLAPERYRVAARIADEWKPDIIHGAIIEGYTVASIVGRWKRVPVVIMEETSDPQDRRWKGHMLARTMAGLADHCVGVSPSVGRYLTKTLRVPAGKVSVISNGVESPVMASPEQIQSMKRSYGIGDDDLIVGSVGRMDDDTKRFDDLIRAFASLRDLPNAKLILIGDGLKRAAFERLTSELGASDRILFVGLQRHVGHFYALMDVFALASEREAFGLVNAEAMRCALPVVATTVGGIPDVVIDRETGLLVPPHDIDALAGALRRMLTSKTLRKQMGAAGKLRADREFSAERYVADVQALYKRLLAERKR